MSETPLSAAEQLRAEEADIARRQAENDQPLLQRAAELLAGVAEGVAELATLAPNLVMPWVAPHLAALADDHARAAAAVNGGLESVTEVLASEG